MLKTQKEKTILRQGLIALGAIALIYIFVLSPFLGDGSSILDDELDRKGADIKKYIARTGSLPSKESFKKLESQTLELEEKFTELVDFIDPEKTRIAQSTTEAGLYFIDKLHSSMKKFSDTAEAKSISLPENLGFGDGLPKESMVDTLLRQLETVELVTGILLENDAIEFTAIKPLKSIDYIESLSKEVLYSEIPVQISMKIDTGALISLLLELKNASPVVSVKEMHVKSGDLDSDKIEVSLVMSTFNIARVIE